ncbi:MAG: DUF6868 family protein [Cellvibrionaceae bacterium]
MEIDILIRFLGWCSIINIGVLLYWAVFLIFAPEWTYRYTARFLEVSRERFNEIHFNLIGVFKILVIIFNIIPYFSLKIIFG